MTSETHRRTAHKQTFWYKKIYFLTCRAKGSLFEKYEHKTAAHCLAREGKA